MIEKKKKGKGWRRMIIFPKQMNILSEALALNMKQKSRQQIIVKLTLKKGAVSEETSCKIDKL